MTITHIFFDLNGILIDSARMRSCYSAQLGIILARRYGLSPEVWSAAYQRVVDDWDSYYADLDLEGDEGLAAMWEGLFRITRALFRLTACPEPDKVELTALVRELPGLAASGCAALHSDAAFVVQKLHATGYIVGITSHLMSTQAQGMLLGGGILQYFAGPIVGPDVVESFRKDAAFFRAAAAQANANPAACLVIDKHLTGLAGARLAGMRTGLLLRESQTQTVEVDLVLNSLYDLLNYLGVNKQS